MLSLSVVIPVRNEAVAIEPVVVELAEVLSAVVGLRYEAVVVDDGSSDATWRVLKRLQAEFPWLSVMRLERPAGKSAALSVGCRVVSGDAVGLMDGDGQNDPVDLLRLLELLGDGPLAPQAVFGCRTQRVGLSWSRRLTSAMGNRLARWATGLYHVSDVGCGVKVVRREALDSVLPLAYDRHRLLAAWLALYGFDVCEAPVCDRPRMAGESCYGRGWGRLWAVLFDVLALYVLFGAIRQPLRFFGRWGVCALGVSLASFAAASALKLGMGMQFDATPLPVLAGVSGLFGTGCLFAGVVLEVMGGGRMVGVQPRVSERLGGGLGSSA